MTILQDHAQPHAMRLDVGRVWNVQEREKSAQETHPVKDVQ